jgi:superoxide dismutase, Cu-Zn family
VRSIICIASLLASLCIPAVAQEAHSHVAGRSTIVEIKNAQGETVGTAALTPSSEGVRIKLDIKNLPPGQHSMHIHQVAKCEAPDFKSAGPHFNAAGHAQDGTMSGDIPNFFLIVAEDHTAHVTVVAPNVSMGADSHSVFSNGGTALVIHAAEGGAPGNPARIACGVITKPE